MKEKLFFAALAYITVGVLSLLLGIGGVVSWRIQVVFVDLVIEGATTAIVCFFLSFLTIALGVWFEEGRIK